MNYGIVYFDSKRIDDTSITAKILTYSACSTLVDMLLQPIRVVQSRFILQDRRKNFVTYNNIVSVLKSAYKTKTLYAGAFGYIPLNVIIMSTYFSPGSDSELKTTLLRILPVFVSYPITTVMRRVECQSNDKGMLEFRYKGFTGALIGVYRDEGIKALYRGCAANFLLVSAGIFITLASRAQNAF